jgi:hypothetical protein
MRVMEIKKKATPVATVAPKTPYRVKVKAPTTRIHHCYTNQVFTSTPVEMDEIDSWTQAQIDAEKLMLC